MSNPFGSDMSPADFQGLFDRLSGTEIGMETDPASQIAILYELLGKYPTCVVAQLLIFRAPDGKWALRPNVSLPLLEAGVGLQEQIDSLLVGYNKSISEPFVKKYEQGNAWPRTIVDQYPGKQVTWAELWLLASIIPSNDKSQNGIHISLFDENHQTRVQSGGLIVDAERERGYVITSVDVEIGAGPSSTGLAADQPENSSGATNVANSSSKGWSASVGAFGQQPTGSIGYDSSQSNTISQIYNNVTVRNVSQGTLLHHYALAASSGGAFNAADDLIDSPDARGERKIHDVDRMMKGDNIPLISQGFWPIEVGYSGPVYIWLNIAVNGLAANLHSSGNIFQGDSYQVQPKVLLEICEQMNHLCDFRVPTS